MRTQNFKWNKLQIGTCYYPEHWDESLWVEDLTRMHAVGIHTIRVAEFAWNLFEPEEGMFTFDLFDRFLEVALAHEMQVIFSTPTATPPAWLTTKYPETLNCNINGTPYYHGARRNYTYNSLVYQTFCKRIVTKLGAHYGAHPAIVGWQIDNELNCEIAEFYSESDSLAFRVFLKKKYKTLFALNQAWGTVFWNQTYTAWDDIFVPRNVIHNVNNQHLVLDYKRFISDSAIRFCKMQSDILRKHVPSHVYITTNGIFDNLDHHTLTDECLDVYTYDSYPNFAYAMVENPKENRFLNDRKWSNHLTDMRSMCPHFGIMEQQSGANGWPNRIQAPAPKPGQVTLWAMQSVAHGADYVSFFRWRTTTKGTEIYWHGILDYDNEDTRKLAEIKEFNKNLEKIQDIANSQFIAQVAIVKDYTNIWDSEIDDWHKWLDKASTAEINVACQISHTPLDYLYLLENTTLEDLLAYQVLVYPHPYILTDATVELLESYVAAGGNLVLGARTGLKDENGKCEMTKVPGRLQNLAGIRVKEYTLIGPNDDEEVAQWGDVLIDMPIFNEVIEVISTDVKVLATYQNNYYASEPAFTERTIGSGKVLYWGSTFTRETWNRTLTYLDADAPFDEQLTLPECCELCIREKDGKTFAIVLNYDKSAVQISLHKEMLDMYASHIVTGIIELKPYETKVYQLITY